MTKQHTFKALSQEEIKGLTQGFEIAYDLLSITLTNNDILIGSLEKNWNWDKDFLTIGFNSHEGEQFGMSVTVEIPLEFVSNIQEIPVHEDSISKLPDNAPQFEESGIEIDQEKFTRLPVQSYPNPLASIIYSHNLEIIEALNFTYDFSLRHSLSTDAIAPDGIFFRDDFLMYGDWDFFSRQVAGSTSLTGGVNAGVTIEVNKDMSPSLQNFVIEKLRNSIVERLGRITNLKISQDVFVRGCILLPAKEINTEIEGDECFVALCAINDEKDDRTAIPVLIKRKYLKYPYEFVGRINSVLTFNGEIMQAPISVMDERYKYIFLARAIVYFEK